MMILNRLGIGMLALVTISACVAGGAVYSSYLNNLPLEARETAKLVISSSEHQAQFKLCPTDVYSEQRAIETTTREVCEDDLLSCYNVCMNGEVSACFWIAHAFQTTFLSENASGEESLVAFPLYMKSCSLGDTNSCTNAAATARNGIWPEGQKPVRAASDSCQKASYLIDCTDNKNSSGCSMLSYHYPESLPKNMQ